MLERGARGTVDDRAREPGRDARRGPDDPSVARLVRILLVDDDADIAVIARLALEALGGFDVRIAASGDEALRIVETFVPDLILLDVMMPGLDGPGTLLALRQKPGTAAIPIVFLTAKVQPHEVAQYKDLGALDVIYKPFDPITLATTLHDIWNRRDDRPA